MRLWPKSLLGQVLLAVALALLVAQTISATLLWRAGENRRDQAALNSAAFRLVTENQNLRRAARDGESQLRRERGAERRLGDRRGTRRGPRRALIGDTPRPRLPRSLRLETTGDNPLLDGETRKSGLEVELTATLEQQGIPVADLIVVQRQAIDDPFVRARPQLLRRVANADDRKLTLIVAALKTDGSDEWQVARGIKPPPQIGAIWGMITQTLLIYLVLVGLHFLLLRRITRPLAALTKRTEMFGQYSQGTPPLEATGPEDVRRLIAAHNSMEARIAALLDEKDVMLGAIGHDLKTPLAALRVRIESVDDERERSKMAESIEDISRSLDDILSLARVGRASEPPEKAELFALTASVVEEFEDLGKPVTLIGADRLTARVHVTWLKRGLRNLIDNALRYAGTAEVSLLRQDGSIILRVDDTGPGIPEAALATIAEPFTRGEASRNRQTGGAGLGLTLARAIAEQHGGSLILANRAQGGLRVEIRFPD